MTESQVKALRSLVDRFKRRVSAAKGAGQVELHIALADVEYLVALADGQVLAHEHRVKYRKSIEQMALAAPEPEPEPCEVCGELMQPGTPTHGGVAHWHCANPEEET